MHLDQEEDIFICFAYEPNSDQVDGKAVIQEMTDYMDKKCGKFQLFSNYFDHA